MNSHGPSALDAAASALRGGALGAAAGALFHAVGGSVVRAQGRSTLTPAHVAGEAARAAARLGAVAAGYTLVRAALQRAQRSDALACAGAGAAAVAVPTLLDERRVRLLRGIFGEALAGAGAGGGAAGVSAAARAAAAARVPLHLVGAASALSGALVLGGADILLFRGLGLRW